MPRNQYHIEMLEATRLKIIAEGRLTKMRELLDEAMGLLDHPDGQHASLDFQDDVKAFRDKVKELTNDNS